MLDLCQRLILFDMCEEFDTECKKTMEIINFVYSTVNEMCWRKKNTEKKKTTPVSKFSSLNAKNESLNMKD
jgi:hypothetical protein